ncbi:MAG: hypothetical protein KDA75_12855, partial [Planctomycetaceae bacterium]|nr:hypothetical protein [Planctomycetaceae bacterium]
MFANRKGYAASDRYVEVGFALVVVSLRAIGPWTITLARRAGSLAGRSVAVTGWTGTISGRAISFAGRAGAFRRTPLAVAGTEAARRAFSVAGTESPLRTLAVTHESRSARTEAHQFG